MDDKVFVPSKIRVGYQDRSDTYTKRLAYVIYYDARGKLRKQASWESWRDKSIEPDEYENVPTSGFVLNKKVGDYVSDWNHRQAYVRVYDPRNFEFEITIENLLYILENASSIKGKGLEGEFVYGWHGTDLILLPTSSPDYAKIDDFTQMIANPEKLKGKDLILGGTYRSSKNEDLIYMGRFDLHTTKWVYPERGDPDYDGHGHNVPVNKGLHYFFAHKNGGYETFKTLGRRIVKTISTEPDSSYADKMDDLESSRIFSPLDKSKDEYIPATIDDIPLDERGIPNRYYGYHNGPLFCEFEPGLFRQAEIRYDYEYQHGVGFVNVTDYYVDIGRMSNVSRDTAKRIEEETKSATIEELLTKANLFTRRQYLENGKVMKH